jgi:hypothetical protein
MPPRATRGTMSTACRSEVRILINSRAVMRRACTLRRNAARAIVIGALALAQRMVKAIVPFFKGVPGGKGPID